MKLACLRTKSGLESLINYYHQRTQMHSTSARLKEENSLGYDGDTAAVYVEA